MDWFPGLFRLIRFLKGSSISKEEEDRITRKVIQDILDKSKRKHEESWGAKGQSSLLYRQ
jgi:hypothetical protein